MAPEREPHRPQRLRNRDSHREDYARSLLLPVVTCRAGGRRDAGRRHQHRRSRNSWESNVESVREPQHRVTVELDAGYVRPQTLPGAIAQLLNAGGLDVDVLLRPAARHAQTDDGGHVLRARTQASLVPCAEGKRKQWRAASHVERTDAFGRVQLVSRDGEKVDAQLTDVDRHLPHGLTPRIARLFDSVPPDVNTTSSASHQSRAATCLRAFSTAARAMRPTG